MRARTRALLINALVFPGMGQLLIQHRRLVGGVLVAGSLVAIVGLCWAMSMQVLEALAGLSTGTLADLPLELMAVLMTVLKQPKLEVLCWVMALATCWVLALVDSALCGPKDRV